MSYTIEEITKHQYEVTAICIDGEYWDIDYVNMPQDTDDGRGNFMCYNREEVYLIDHPKLEFRRIYYDELVDKEDVVLYKEVSL